MIQEATVLVAELTGKNANVFYELGLGHAIGKPIILISETMEDVPFDLQPLRVINYDKDNPSWGNKLKNNLIKAIEETLKTPIEAVPPMFRKIVKSKAPAESESNIRLLALERKVSALTSELEHLEYSPSDSHVSPTREIEEQLMRTRSVPEAIKLIRGHLKRGVPRKILYEALESLYPRGFSKHIMAEAEPKFQK